MLVASFARLGVLEDSGRADAQILLAHVLGRSRAWLIAHGEALVSTPEARRFNDLCARRAAGAPIAYLLGSAYFYGREFAVDENVLVPRPETEALVEYALQFAARSSASQIRALDVGTGSGALACTLAAELPSAVVDASDRSDGALEVARRNARSLGVEYRCNFYLGDLAAPVAGRRYDLILANLPYVATGDIPEPPDSLAFEPRLALDGGPDGLRAYVRLLPQLPPLLVPGGLALLEAAPHQLARLSEACRATFPSATVAVERDLGGLERFVTVLLTEG